MKIILAFAILASVLTETLSQWTGDVRLTLETAASSLSYNNARCIAANGNSIHIVWYDARDFDYEIYYKRSSNGGLNWSQDIRLTNFPTFSFDPSICVSGSNVHVVWQDFRDGNEEIYYKRSTNNGVDWGFDTRMTFDSSLSGSPSITADGLNLHLLWHDFKTGNAEIHYKRSSNGGLTWDLETNITNFSNASGYPSSAVSGPFLHVVWNDARTGNFEVYYKHSTDYGISWGSDIQLTNSTDLRSIPSVSVSGNFVHVVWHDFRDGNWEIYHKRSTNSGSQWQTDVRLTNNPQDSWYPSIVASGSLVHVVWYDGRDGATEIYYKISTDNGANWNTDLRLTTDPSLSEFPYIAISSSDVHVLWQDYRDGNSEMYYKRNPNGNAINISNISTEVPMKFELNQNYPNPFNPITRIKFAIPRQSFVTLKIFDIAGREVLKVTEAEMNAGTYSYDWNASGFASGIYFYRLTGEGFTDTKKMMLLK